jgi:DNA polymerase III delta subunit
MLDKGEDRFAIAKALGLAPFFAKDIIAQSSRWSVPKLVGSLQALSITDKALKSSPLPQSLWLENFVIKVCR